MKQSRSPTSPIRVFSHATRSAMKRKARQEISPQTREFRATNLEQRLKNALRFIATIFDEVSRPENKQELADALPDGKFLCQIAQFVCRRCQLSCFDFLIRLVEHSSRSARRLRSSLRSCFHIWVVEE